jgi:thioredoxin reductase
VASRTTWDVIVVGAGPAGLSAALVLGRCRRRVLVLDSGRPRNAASPALHGFLSRDGVTPAELLRFGRAQLRPYDTVALREGEATGARVVRGHFVVRLAGGSVASRKLLFATGVVDSLPEVEGAARLYGRGVFHCPYCDAWEVRDRPVAVYGKGTKGLGLCRTLLAWTSDLVLCTDGPARLPKADQEFLARHGVAVRKEPVEGLEGDDRLRGVALAGGEVLPAAALFFNTEQYQRSGLPEELGCRGRRAR